MHKSEIEIISRFAATELAGALLIGKWARLIDDHFLRTSLTYHCYDEARHSWLWTEFLNNKGVETQQEHGKNEYFEYLASLKDPVYFLAAMHVYELRVPFHLDLHASHPDIDPELKSLMLEISKDEKHHLGWINNYLKTLQKEKPELVANAIREAGELEARTYIGFMEGMKGLDDYYTKLVQIIEQNLPRYPSAWKEFLA